MQKSVNYVQLFFRPGPVFGGCGFEEGLCGWVSSTDTVGEDWWVRTSPEEAEGSGVQAPTQDFADSRTGEIQRDRGGIFGHKAGM